MIDYPLHYQRRQTREVKVGQIAMGGQNPIRIQSMLANGLSDMDACMREIQLLVEAGCEIIRLALPSRKELELVPTLRKALVENGFSVPLVADVHFSPALAIEACEFFEKVRINPGNYADTPKNNPRGQSNPDFEAGTDHLRELLQPLVTNLKKYHRSLRIGVNQGSLSKRMMEKYGDTPVGMVESALEMIALLEEQGIEQIVVSLKSSNPLVVSKAYRLLAQRLPKKNAIPFHLGVTEAGSGLMGRIKSLAGIGPLLADGIGDTIRVSLTEASYKEIPVARDLIRAAIPSAIRAKDEGVTQEQFFALPLSLHRIVTQSHRLGGIEIGGGSLIKIGVPTNLDTKEMEIPLESDFIYRQNNNAFDLFPLHSSSPKNTANNGEVLPALLSDICSKDATGNKEKPHNDTTIVFPEGCSVFSVRRFLRSCSDTTTPPCGVLYTPDATKTNESQLVNLASLLSDGLLDFILISANIKSDEWLQLVYLLQATRKKIFTADYIACPSCSRTLFDIQTVTETIKKKTAHLKGVKIAIMGCIVNGPGEMADADFGYVGSGPGKVDLYLGQKKVERNIDESVAIESLVELIKGQGRWNKP